MKKLRVTVDGQTYDVEVEPLEAPAAASASAPAAAAPAPSGGGQDVPSPLAGKVVEVKTSIGAQVGEGEDVLILEAMKMNTMVSSPIAGGVQAIHVSPGDLVEEGQALLTIG